MIKRWLVKALTHQGRIIVLKSGFRSEDAALDHRVKLAFWKRVWVEPQGAQPERNGSDADKLSTEPVTLGDNSPTTY